MPPDTLVTQLIQRLTVAPVDHERFLGEPIDIGGLSALEFGHLWSAIRRARRSDENPAARVLADNILQQAQERALRPAFDEQTCLGVFQEIERWDEAIECLSCLVCDPPPCTRDRAAPHPW